LFRRCGGRTRAQFLSRRLASPGTRIDLTHHVQPFFGFAQRREVTHVEPETLAALFEPTTHEKREPLELRQIRLCERHRRRRRA
jgi:hypothetical protein